MTPSTERESIARTTSVPHAIEALVDRDPDAVAIESGAARLTYGELDALANRVARRLRADGVERGDIVGVCAERGPETIVAALGVQKAGAAYAPLDPGSPSLRLLQQLEEVRARAIVAPAHLVDRTAGSGLPTLALDPSWTALADEDPARLDLEIGPDDLYAVIFTSGSTGLPKGIMVEHRNILNLVDGVPDLRPQPGEGALQVCAPQFDVAAFEVWATLLSGARLVSHPPGVPDPRAVCRTIVEHGVTWSAMATSTFHQLAESGVEELAGMRIVLVGGEALLPRYVRGFRAACPQTRLVNIYAPSEATVFATALRPGLPRRLPEDGACKHLRPAGAHRLRARPGDRRRGGEGRADPGRQGGRRCEALRRGRGRRAGRARNARRALHRWAGCLAR